MVAVPEAPKRDWDVPGMIPAPDGVSDFEAFHESYGR